MPDLNALAPVSDIQSVIAFVNQYGQTVAGSAAGNLGGARLNPEVFYSKQLLDTIRLDAAQFPYFRLADAMPIQEKADKLQVRRWSALQGHITPLVEGIPPKSDKGSVQKYELEAFSYGRYMEFTDRVDFVAVDPIVAHFSKEYSIVAIETLDLLAREALLLNAQKYFAGGKLSITELTFENAVPNMTDLRKIGLALKKSLVKPRANGKYQVIGSPEFFYDMLNDATVKAYMTINNTTKTMYDNSMLVPLFGFEFYETMVVPTSGEYVDEDGVKRLRIYTGTIGGEGAEAVVYGVHENTAPATLVEDLNETDDLTVAAGYAHDFATRQDASYLPEMKTWTVPQDYSELKFQHILILGKDALTRTGLQGQDSAKMYVKALGSSGVLDPIDQRQSIGFKINSIGFGSVHPEAIIDYVCIPTQVNV